MKKPAVASQPRYRRILLKLSGEALGGVEGQGINPEAVHDMACQVAEVQKLGVEVVIVVGGGNIFRGLQGSEKGIERATGDYMGMRRRSLTPWLSRTRSRSRALRPASKAPST